ncbi:hypothetical protein CVO96_09070 [Deinococcus koreensis]|uniref:Uncharacterized protein n=1 Tax=Deinococcus koreensis TaxID=2054903 RepID=A0A2K3UYA6_9DEIO|nr:hypothetical protein CVO96_09070 [Deinococcus koreensis]
MFSVLLCAALVGCAPSASSGTANAQALQGPLPLGETWVIGGLDQNNNKIEGKVTLTRAPSYRDSDQRWFYGGDTGYALYYEQATGNATFRVWDVSKSGRLVACYVFRPFSADQKSYSGAGLAGTEEEIDAVFAKLSGSGTRLVGGECTLTRS